MLRICLSVCSEAEEAHARLIETTAKLDASETCCRELEGKLSLLRKKSENAFGEERLKVMLVSWAEPNFASVHTLPAIRYRFLGASVLTFFLSTLHTVSYQRHLRSPRKRLRLLQQGGGRRTWSARCGKVLGFLYASSYSNATWHLGYPRTVADLYLLSIGHRRCGGRVWYSGAAVLSVSVRELQASCALR